MLKEYINKVIEFKNLTENEAEKAMEIIMDGKATTAQIGSFITALRMKGETVDEITGLAKTMRSKAARIHPKVEYSVDTCGTGGDKSNTFNISTAAAIIASAGGVYIAKHGNRSMSSLCGSADVLEALGITIDLKPAHVEKSIETIGIGFMFAQAFHLSMKHAAAPRKELGIKTVFNILGPLTNPANANGQVLGIFDKTLSVKIAEVLSKLNVEKALVVHGSDGLDELTLCGESYVTELIDGKIKEYTVKPEDFGLKTCDPIELKGGNAEANAQILENIFKGKKDAKRDITVLNAGAVLYVGKKADSIEAGIRLAEKIIDDGLALKKLYEFREFTTYAEMP